MSKLFAVLAAGAAMVASVPAQAVTLIANYRLTVNPFGPFSDPNGARGTLDFTIAYDPYATVFYQPVIVTANTIANSNFTGPLRFNVDYSDHLYFYVLNFSVRYTTVTVGGQAHGADSISGNDFVLTFDVNNAGVPGPFQIGGPVYTPGANIRVGDGQTYAAGVSLLSVTAVPEASTWAMMIVGLGVAGTGLRRRRMTKVAYA